MKKDDDVDAVKRKRQRLLLLNGIGTAPRGEGSIVVLCDGNVNVDDDDDDNNNAAAAAAAAALTLAAMAAVLR